MAPLNHWLARLPMPVAWLVGLVPLALLAADAATGALGVDPTRDIEHRLGRTAIYLLIAVLAVSPMRRAGLELGRFRRVLGLLTFVYAALHSIAWVILDMGMLWPQVLGDLLRRRYLTAGAVALLILAILAASSTAAAHRRLGPARWKTLHSLIWLAASLGCLHWLWAYKIWPGKALAVGAAILFLLALRLFPGDSRRKNDK